MASARRGFLCYAARGAALAVEQAAPAGCVRAVALAASVVLRGTVFAATSPPGDPRWGFALGPEEALRPHRADGAVLARVREDLTAWALGRG